MKTLFITNGNTPFRVHTGGGQRSYNICKVLSELGQVDIIEINKKPISGEKIDIDVNFVGCLCPKSRKEKIKNTLLRHLFYFIPSLFNIRYFFPYDKEIANYIAYLIKDNNYNLVVCRYLASATTPNLVGEGLKDVNLIIDLDDDPVKAFDIQSQFTNIPILQKIYKYNIKKFYNFIKKKSSFNLLSNKNDINHKSLYYLPNIPYVTKHDIKRNDNPELSLLFVGQLDYRPNLNGIIHFIDNIWPLLITDYPELKFHIVGKGLPEFYKVKYKNIEGLKFEGFVKDPSHLFTDSMIYVSPIYEGAGTNIKILEAMHYEIPIVSSYYSSQGFNEMLKDGENIMIAENDYEFVSKIKVLIENKMIRDKMASKAKSDLSRFGYTYEEFSKNLKTIIRKLCKI